MQTTEVWGHGVDLLATHVVHRTGATLQNVVALLNQKVTSQPMQFSCSVAFRTFTLHVVAVGCLPVLDEPEVAAR